MRTHHQKLGELPPTQALPGVLRKGPRTRTTHLGGLPSAWRTTRRTGSRCHPDQSQPPWPPDPQLPAAAPTEGACSCPSAPPTPAWSLAGEPLGAHTGYQTSRPPQLTDPDAQRTPVPTWRPSVPFGAPSLSPKFSGLRLRTTPRSDSAGPGVHSSTGGRCLVSDHHNHTQPGHIHKDYVEKVPILKKHMRTEREDG